MIDLINLIEDIKFEEAWKNRNENKMNTKQGEIKIFYIGLDDLIKNKRWVNRPRGKEDLKFLRALKKRNH